MPKPCGFRRRLAMARHCCQSAQDSTSRAIADKFVASLWPGADCSLFSKTLPPKLQRKKAHSAG